MHKKTFPFIVMALFGMQGCVPGPVVFWAPSAEGAIAVNKHCGTAAAPASTLQHSIGKATLLVDGHETYVRLKLSVPSESTAYFKSDNAQIRTLSGQQNYVEKIPPARYYDFGEGKYIETNPLQPMAGNTRQHAFGSEARVFSILLKYQTIHEDEFELTLPAIVVDGLESKSITILFRKTKGFGIFPVNC